MNIHYPTPEEYLEIYTKIADDFLQWYSLTIRIYEVNPLLCLHCITNILADTCVKELDASKNPQAVKALEEMFMHCLQKALNNTK